MRRVVSLATMLLALGGCTVYDEYWEHPDATEAQFEAVAANCESAALARFPPVTLGVPGYFRAQNEWCTPTAGGDSCSIISPGYLPQARSAVDTNGWRRRNEFHACMRAAGWRRTYSSAVEALPFLRVNKAIRAGA